MSYDKRHISYSEWYNHVKCAYRHKLKYVDGLSPFEDSKFTVFGTSVHHMAELLVEDDPPFEGDINEEFCNVFSASIRERLQGEELESTLKIEQEWTEQGLEIIPEIVPALTKYLTEIYPIKVEHKLWQLVDGFSDFYFKGFVDLVVGGADGKIHIIDWKTCSWGWGADKRRDTLKQYQLTLYKHFFCKENDLDPKKVETHFGLLKRTAAPGYKIEFIRISSGPKKVQNVLDKLRKSIIDIALERYPKNKKSCDDWCPFKNTEYCK